MKYFNLVLMLIALAVFCADSSAQGGWRQWRVHLLDGTELEANPLGMNEAGRFTRGMGEQAGIERSEISYLAISRRELPPMPKTDLNKDMVVMIDGRYTLGKFRFREFKFSEGVVLQNGNEITTENIAYIRFARPKKKRSD